jgi:ABC-2 type transport system permease protein
MTDDPRATGTLPRRAFRRLVTTEARLAWRQPAGLLWGLGLPVLTVIVLGNIPGLRRPQAVLGGSTFFDVYVPTLMVLVLCILGVLALPVPLATYRELGVLRRISTTPVPPSRVLAAQLVVNLALAALTLLLILAIAALAFGMSLPRQMPGFLLTMLLTALCLFSLGLCVAAVARTARAAVAIGNAIFFPLAFAAGLWVPQQMMPPLLRSISQAMPTGAAVAALNASLSGTFPPAWSLLALAAYAAAFAAIATKTFRWE